MKEIHLMISILGFMALFILTLIRTDTVERFTYSILNTFITILIRTGEFTRRVKVGERITYDVTTYQFDHIPIDLPEYLILIFVVMLLIQYFSVFDERPEIGFSLRHR